MVTKELSGGFIGTKFHNFWVSPLKIIVTSCEPGPRTEYIPLRQYYHRCRALNDTDLDITVEPKLYQNSTIFLAKYCSKALPFNILGDPGHHPLRQQCGLPISLWVVGSTKGAVKLV